MKAKKVLSLLLCLCMVLGLAACSGGGNQNSPAPSNAGNTANDPAGDGETVQPVGDPVNLVLSTPYKQSDSYGGYLQYFMDYCTEHSGGTITFTPYFAGTIGSAVDEIGMMSQGNVDIIAYDAAVNAFNAPGFIFCFGGYESVEGTRDMFHHLCFDNEATAAIYKKYADASNMTLLGVIIPNGYNCYVSSKPFKDFEDFKNNIKIGVKTEATYTQMGFKSIATVTRTQDYEDIRSGFVDGIESSVDKVISMKLYEVAPYVLMNRCWNVGNWLGMNTDKFNSLSPEQQAVVKEAAQAMEDYAIEKVNELQNQLEELVAANGGSVTKMSDDEFKYGYLNSVLYMSYPSVYSGLAAATGTEEDCKIVTGEVYNYLGYPGFPFTEMSDNSGYYLTMDGVYNAAGEKIDIY